MPLYGATCGFSHEAGFEFDREVIAKMTLEERKELAQGQLDQLEFIISSDAKDGVPWDPSAIKRVRDGIQLMVTWKEPEAQD